MDVFFFPLLSSVAQPARLFPQSESRTYGSVVKEESALALRSYKYCSGVHFQACWGGGVEWNGSEASTTTTMNQNGSGDPPCVSSLHPPPEMFPVLLQESSPAPFFL